MIWNLGVLLLETLLWDLERKDLFLLLKVELHMMVNGWEIRGMARASRSGLMVLVMMASGSIIRRQERGHFIMLIRMFTLENGRTIELMVMGCIDNRMEPSMRGSGEMIFNMDSERNDVIYYIIKKKGLMVRAIKGDMMKEGSKGRESILGLMGLIMKVNGLIIK